VGGLLTEMLAVLPRLWGRVAHEVCGGPDLASCVGHMPEQAPKHFGITSLGPHRHLTETCTTLATNDALSKNRHPNEGMIELICSQCARVVFINEAFWRTYTALGPAEGTS
jgi:hypothetical protein